MEHTHSRMGVLNSGTEFVVVLIGDVHFRSQLGVWELTGSSRMPLLGCELALTST